MTNILVCIRCYSNRPPRQQHQNAGGDHDRNSFPVEVHDAGTQGKARRLSTRPQPFWKLRQFFDISDLAMNIAGQPLGKHSIAVYR